MTLHQLTHSASLDIDFGRAARHALAAIIALPLRWAETRREEAELARLDRRELADLATRR